MWNITDGVIQDFQKEALAFVAEKKKEKEADGRKTFVDEKEEDRIFNEWERQLEKILTAYIAGIVRSKLEARVTSTVTIVGNRLVSSAVQSQLEKARGNYYGKVQKCFDELQKKEREGLELTEKEMKLKAKYEQKVKDFSQAWDVEEHSKNRVAELEEGGTIGLPELRGLANDDGTTIILETADGQTKELVPKNGNTSGKVVRLKETEKGHLVPADDANYQDGARNDKDCVVRAFLFAKNGPMPTDSEVGNERHRIANIAAKDPTLQLHNFIWRDQPALLARCGRVEPRKEVQSIFGALFNRRRLGHVSREQLESCIKSEIKKISEEYGEDLAPDQLNKILAARIHQTEEGNAYLGNINRGKDYVFSHMMSEKDAKALIDGLATEYYNEVSRIEADSSMTKNEKSERIKNCESRRNLQEVMNDIACDDLLENQLGHKTLFASEAMKLIDKAVKQKDLILAERRAFIVDAARIVTGSPGNGRIGSSSANISIGENLDIQQGCRYGERKMGLYKKYPGIIKHDGPNRSSSTPANQTPRPNPTPKSREE